ncbi:hypothetical protein [Parabacteroides sp. PF5-9]|uniref:hypothetical protein n=1 Tax=Parabacteroides sp. PF5-9 TaxID=1742404 RepID=UPI002476F7D6|nr:hypothetical protein [Parabacteroides sp. PF5-9]
MKQIRIIIFLFGLLLINEQLAAQNATLVTIFKEDFERPEFSDGYILPNPGIGNFYDFTYATAVPMASNVGECIITQNSDLVGHGYSHPGHNGSGYYLFAVKEAGTDPKKIYSVTVPAVKKGQTVQFGVYYDDVDGGYNFEIQATGTGIGGETKTSDLFYNSGGGWIFWSYTVTATQDGELIFSIRDKYGYGDNSHKFGIDDIAVTQKAIHITSPASLAANTQVNTQVSSPFQAEYYNPLGDAAYTYVWQKYNGSSWVEATGVNATGSGNATSFTANFTPAAEDTEGYVNYRLVVTAGGSDVFYSDVITVEYISDEYLFKEDFGGNWISTDQTDISGASGDWWVKPGAQPSIITDFNYGSPDNTSDSRDKAEVSYGQRPIKLDVDGSATYAITKLAGWKLPLPGYAEGDKWKWGDGEGGGKGGFDDHTFPGDNSKGYFMYSVNRENTVKTVYEATIPVTSDMLGKSYSFSAWQVALWGRADAFPYQFKLEVENTSASVTDFAEFEVSDDWEERKLLFYIPTDYSGSTITIRISSQGDNLWLGLDDITLTDYDSYVTITSPSSGSSVGLNATFSVDYQYVSSTINYRWQKSVDGVNDWTDITASDGTATGVSGTFFANIFSVEDGFYYRVLITKGGHTNFAGAMASTPVQLFRDTDYLFKEDFGGNWISTDQTDISGASGDWWIKPGTQPSIITDFNYGQSDDSGGSADKVENAYGQRPIELDVKGAATYAITKLAGWQLPIPGYPGDEWIWGYGSGNGKGGFDDHTFPGDNSKGYFMYSVNLTNSEKTVYEATIPVTSDMLGKSFTFSSWQVALWGRVDELPYQFKLEVENASETVTDFAEFKVGDNWEERKLLFYIPSNYSGSTITIRISSVGNNLWLGLDDILLTDYNSYVTITSPSSGSSVGMNATFSVNYQYVSSTINYRWQKSVDGVNDWTDITTFDGTATGISGTFATNISSVEDGYYYRVLITKGDHTNFAGAIASSPVQLFRDTDYLLREDFGGCDSEQNFIYKADNFYEIPGYEYVNADAGTVRPNPGSGYYIITNQVYLNYWTNGENPEEITTEWYTDVTDHSGCGNGYFLQVHARKALDDESMQFYKTNLSDLCAGSKLSFKAWIADLETNSNTTQNFKFLVSFNNGETEEYTTGKIEGGHNAPWKQYGFDFFVPQGASSATLSILAEGDWDWGKAFAMDDIEVRTLSAVQILRPTETQINVLYGQEETLTGSYACGDLTGTLTYQWQERTESGIWVNSSGTGATGTHSNANFTTNYTTKPIENTIYYRFMVTGDNDESAYSDVVKFIPQEVSDSKTYFVCPDNMTDSQASYYRGSGEKYLPGMVSLGEPGYLPSLIRMEAPEILGITYKWYTSKDGGAEDELEDLDEYDPSQIYSSEQEVQDPILISDGKTHTISVQNERNTKGEFKERTYWLEICDSYGVPFPDTERIEYSLMPGYLCGSLEAVVSPANARRIHRESFGGTDPGDPKIKPTPLENITIDYVQYTVDDGNLPEGGYMITKVSPGGESGGWATIQDHFYEGQSNEEHGYLVAVNASATPGHFYTHQLTNLGACRNIELVVTGWFTSFVNWNGLEKVNLKFILTNSDTGEVLSEFISGNMVDGEGNNWRQFGFRFFVPEDVTSITMEVVNNNFGTGGGNDVLMDDIEIYLVIPPVTLVPSVNGHVCGAEEGIAILEGTYTDDGTLGNNLEYRWEFSSTGKDGPWQVIAGSNGSVTSGVITTEKSHFVIEHFTAVNNGHYRLVVGQLGVFDGTPNYACMAVSEPRQLIFAASVDNIPAPSLVNNKTAFCYSDVDEDGFVTFINQDTQVTDNKPYASYTWMVDALAVADTTAKTLKLKLADYAPGYYTVSLTASNSVGCTEASLHEFVLFPKETTWTGKGDPNNWNDFRNWNNGVPGYCTNVIIPNEAIDVETTTLLDHYPLLIKPTVDSLNIENNYINNQSNLNLQKEGQNNGLFSLRPACDTITFKMGGGVARTNYLNYKFARVDLDVKPSRWYTVAAPLRAMYSGDYFVEGNVRRQNPAVYMMKYNTTNPQTGDTPVEVTGDFSNPFNTLTEDLYPGLGYAIGVYDGEDTAAELQPFRFPKDSASYAIWNYHGVHLGNTTTLNRDSMGRFTYERLIQIENNLPTAETTGFTTIVKDDQGSYKTALLGNPFMSHLDFDQFKTANPAITGGYYIWTANNTFEAYKPGAFSNDPNLIAPMQSFIVEKTGQISTLQFDFTMSKTTSNITLRSGSVENALLRVDVLRDQVSHSHVRLQYNPLEENSYHARKDMWTLFSEENTEPAVLYALLDGKAASIRTLGDLSEPIELGIRTDVKGKLTLRLSGMETLDISQDIYLEDTFTGTLQNMRDIPEYTFDNQTGSVQGRLFLRIGEKEEEGETPDSDIRITTYNGWIMVSSSVDDPIESVKIHTLNGRLIYNKHAIEQSSISFNTSISQQVVLVTVTTRQRQKTEKAIVQ